MLYVWDYWCLIIWKVEPLKVLCEPLRMVLSNQNQVLSWTLTSIDVQSYDRYETFKILNASCSSASCSDHRHMCPRYVLGVDKVSGLVNLFQFFLHNLPDRSLLFRKCWFHAWLSTANKLIRLVAPLSKTNVPKNDSTVHSELLRRLSDAAVGRRLCLKYCCSVHLLKNPLMVSICTKTMTSENREKTSHRPGTHRCL